MQINWDSLMKLAIGFLAGSGLMAFIFKELIKEKRQRSNIKWKEKRMLAKDIMVFIDEGQGAGYEIPFDSNRYKEASRLVSQTLPYSEKLSKNINQFCGLWAVYAMMNPNKMKIPKHQYEDLIKDLSEKRQIIDEKVEGMRNEVAKWLK